MSIIPYGKHFIDNDDINEVIKVLKGQNLTQGPTIDLFEKNIANYVGSKYAVAVSSCTAGLHIASLAAGLDHKSLLLTSPISFVATSNVAFYCNSKPIFCDVEKDSINLCPEKLEEKFQIYDNIKIVIPVHFGGKSANMAKIKSVCKKYYDPVLIEDAAHALGAKYDDGSMVGNCKYSDMTVFSLHPVKIIAAGEGGVITTNNEALYKKLIRLRSHGINKIDDFFINEENSHTNSLVNPWYYEMQEIGYHYRITDFQCALANSQLQKIDMFIKKRKSIANKYDEIFNNNPLIHIGQIDKENSSNHLYVVRINFNKINISRAELMTDLKSKNIISQVHYIPITSHPYYQKKKYNTNDYPEASKYYNEALSLPIYYSLSDEEQNYVVNTIKDIIN